jgi:hypothetical protein
MNADSSSKKSQAASGSGMTANSSEIPGTTSPTLQQTLGLNSGINRHAPDLQQLRRRTDANHPPSLA